MDKFKWKRTFTCVVVTIYTLLMGIPSSLGFGVWEFIQPLGMSILDFMDFISNSVLMPIVALLTCIFVGHIIKPETVIEEACVEGATFRKKHIFVWMIKWVAPILLVIILVTSVAGALGFAKFAI
jgi:NSS family neurotransmitter:Na+ symporter